MKIHQLLMGKDLAVDRTNVVHSMAAQMSNFCYVIETSVGRCILVDCAWDVDGTLEYCRKQGLTEVECAVFTHRHLDHTGGTFALRRGESTTVPGLKELADRGIPIKMGAEDIEFTLKQTGVKKISPLHDMDEVFENITCLHTPGHTPGSICLLVGSGEKQALITGDTLFIDACGRTDLQESNPEDMHKSLLRLSKLPLTCVVFPGHDYAAVKQSTIQRERERNYAMRGAMISSKGGLSMEPTSGRGVLLPDYLQACRNALLHHEH